LAGGSRAVAQLMEKFAQETEQKKSSAGNSSPLKGASGVADGDKKAATNKVGQHHNRQARVPP
jgi:hypothetical protein